MNPDHAGGLCAPDGMDPNHQRPRLCGDGKSRRQTPCARRDLCVGACKESFDGGAHYP